ncbi:hypothetical protein [Methanobacterium formicicum]|uniref:Uncharacterized protein n=1 Tax=Methanobacterium formicicum TaxID=2162 RepID=A0A843AMB1_METFO|nr:hypothetical protein [Methanobacterium formicicum]MBF4474521.1 hypothetical protein [Methanobacterium formicicum]
MNEDSILKSLPAKVSEIFNSAGVIKTEMIDGDPHIFTTHGAETEEIGRKLNKIGYIYRWYYDFVNEEESLLIGWTKIRKLI